jgi:hypothetical protein
MDDCTIADKIPRHKKNLSLLNLDSQEFSVGERVCSIPNLFNRPVTFDSSAALRRVLK